MDLVALILKGSSTGKLLVIKTCAIICILGWLNKAPVVSSKLI